MAINKVVYGGRVLIDLTADDVTQSDVRDGVTFHGADGTVMTGTSTLDSDTSDDTAVVAEVLVGKTAHARGALLTGTMPNNGAVAGVISEKNGIYTIPNGFHDGSGTVGIASTEQSKLIPANIKSGITVLGVTGSYAGESVTAQSKSVNASAAGLTVLPDSGYDYLSQVEVTISYVETANSAGGITATIAG